jgi:hypothetical protein
MGRKISFKICKVSKQKLENYRKLTTLLKIEKTNLITEW